MSRSFQGKIEKVSDVKWRIPKTFMEGMKVDGVIYADENMIPAIVADNAPQQVANATHLPGIVRASIAMPDIHWGYGLPIGGVVATDIEDGGVISPGGVGYDINCGVRLIRTDIDIDDAKGKIEKLTDLLFASVPAGVGSSGAVNVSKKELREVMLNGAKWSVGKGYGWESDIDFCEENGCMPGADPEAVSDRAVKRGHGQLGTLGSGNHFIEIQEVEDIYSPEIAKVFGIEKGKITVMVHTGSRGFGHQICTDSTGIMVKAMDKYGIKMPDRQLSCVPVLSPHGKSYLGAMSCAANFAWANRQIINQTVRNVFSKVFGDTPVSMGMRLVYDVAHNIAKMEKYVVNGRERRLCVHRKGATRAFGAGNNDVPERYRSFGQPVIIPGDMGRCSYVLAGAAFASETFYSTCHGAGRVLSRAAAVKAARGRSIREELAAKGIFVRWTGKDTLAEEAPKAYKDVNNVVDIVEKAGISLKVARMRPLGVVKG